MEDHQLLQTLVEQNSKWSQRLDLNQRPALYESAALPTELRWQPLYPARAEMPDSIIDEPIKRASRFAGRSNLQLSTFNF